MGEFTILPLGPSTGTHTLDVNYNAIRAEVEHAIGRRYAAINKPYEPRQSYGFWPITVTNSLSGTNLLASGGDLTATNLGGIIGAITGSYLIDYSAVSGPWTNCTFSGNVGEPFQSVAAITGGDDDNTYLPTTWWAVLCHKGFDTTTEVRLQLSSITSTGRANFSNTNTLDNLVTAGIVTSVASFQGRPWCSIGYGYGIARHERWLPYADARHYAEGVVASLPAVTSGANLLPASPAAGTSGGVIRMDGQGWGIADITGKHVRFFDANGKLWDYAIAASSRTALVFYDGSNVAAVGSPVIAVDAGARAMPGKAKSDPNQFYRGVRTPYSGLDLDDTIGNPYKAAAEVGIMRAVSDGEGGTSCLITPQNCFDTDTWTETIGEIDESVTLCGQPVDECLTPQFFWTFRGGYQLATRGLYPSYVANRDYSGSTSIPALNAAEVDLLASVILANAGTIRAGVTNTINVQQGTCTAVVGFSGTNEGSNNAVLVSGFVLPPGYTNGGIRCDVSFHSDDGNYIGARALFVSSNQVNLGDSQTVNSGTGSTCVNGRPCVITFGESAVEPRHVRNPWWNQVGVLVPGVTGDPPAAVDPPTAEVPGQYIPENKSAFYNTRRRQVADYNEPQGFADEGSADCDAFVVGDNAVFVGSNFFDPNIRVGNTYLTAGTDPTIPYYKRLHIGQISQQNPADQAVRDASLSGPVFGAGSFYIQTGKLWWADPVWGGVAATFSGTITASTGTSATFAMPSTNDLGLWSVLHTGTNVPLAGFSFAVDRGTGTNAGTWFIPNVDQRLMTGCASSSGQLVVYWSETATTTTGLPGMLVAPKKLSCWHDHKVTFSPGTNAGSTFTVKATGNSNDWLFFPPTTNTLGAGWKFSIDNPITGGVIRYQGTSAADAWVFATGTDSARLFVSASNTADFTPNPNFNLEDNHKRYGLCVPTQKVTRAMWNELWARLVAIKMILGPDAHPTNNGMTNVASASTQPIFSDGTPATNTVSFMEGCVAASLAGADGSPWSGPASFSSADNTDASSQTSGNWYENPGDTSTISQNTGFSASTTIAYYLTSGSPFLRGQLGTTTLYLYAVIGPGDPDAGLSDEICGSYDAKVFNPGGTSLQYRAYAASGSIASGSTSAGLIGPIGAFGSPAWALGPTNDTYFPVFDDDDNPIGCTTNLSAVNFTTGSGGYLVTKSLTTILFDFDTAADNGF